MEKLRAAPYANLNVQYEATIRGTKVLKITSKKNTVTVKNLPPGNYNVTYKVSAVKNSKRSFSSAKSPKATFVIH